VPAIVISPWTFKGGVNHDQFDHTSIIRFLELFTANYVSGGVACSSSDARYNNLPQNSWRRQTFGDLTSVFKFNDPPPASVADVNAAFPWAAPYSASSGSFPTMAAACAALASQRYAANAGTTLAAPLSQSTQPWSPPPAQSIELILPVPSYDLAEMTKAAGDR
jgi:phospholipase C